MLPEAYRDEYDKWKVGMQGWSATKVLGLLSGNLNSLYNGIESGNLGPEDKTMYQGQIHYCVALIKDLSGTVLERDEIDLLRYYNGTEPRGDRLYQAQQEYVSKMESARVIGERILSSAGGRGE